MGSSVTVRDIAKQANVSHGTVSRVLNNHPAVSDENRARVMRAATELGYVPTRAVRSKSQARNPPMAEVGFLLSAGINTGDQNFWMHILRGVETEATRQAVKLSYRAIGELVETPEKLRAALSDMRLEHVLLAGDADPVIVQALQELHLYFVVIGSRIRGVPLNAVVCDDYEGTYIATKYLIDNGHQRIAFIGNTSRIPGNIPVYSIECRASGYKNAMQEANLPYHDLMFTEPGTLYVSDGYAACKQLLARHVPFTAIFCASDGVAIGVMKALQEEGLRVPEDVSVIGEDSHLTSLVAPNLTTIRTYPEAMGATAVRQIMALVNNPDDLPVVSVLPIDLVIRESVARIHAK